MIQIRDLSKSFGGNAVLRNVDLDVPEGEVTSFSMATKREDDEVIVFSWMIWPDKATCDAAAEKMMADMEGQDMPEMPFDGMRMMWGGFEPVFSWGEGSVA